MEEGCCPQPPHTFPHMLVYERLRVSNSLSEATIYNPGGGTSDLVIYWVIEAVSPSQTLSPDFNLSEGCFDIFLRIFLDFIQILIDFWKKLIKFDYG